MAPARYDRPAARALLVLLVGLVAGVHVPALAAEDADPYGVVVEPASGLVDGATVTVTVAGEVPSAVGLVVAVCRESAVQPMPGDARELDLVAGCDGPGVWALGTGAAHDPWRGTPGTVDLGDTRTVELEVSARFDTTGGVVDCRSQSCGVMVWRDALGPADRHYDMWVPLGFAPPAASPLPAPMGTDSPEPAGDTGSAPASAASDDGDPGEEPPGVPVVIDPIARTELVRADDATAPIEMEAPVAAGASPTGLAAEDDPDAANAAQVALAGLAVLAVGAILMRLGRKRGKLASG